MRKRYTIRKYGTKGTVTVLWWPLRKSWEGKGFYGNEARYVILSHSDKSYTSYLRNPYSKPLLHKGGRA